LPGLPIAVEITPPDAPREQVAVLLAACGRASADAECVPAADVSSSGSRAVAIVTWSGERRVVIEVGLRTDGRPEWRSRTLDFERLDDPLERWRTIGFVVGTLSRPEADLPPIPDAEVSESNPKPMPATEPAKASPSAPPRPAKARPRSNTPPRPAPERAASDAGDAADPPEPERPRSPRSPATATLDLGGVVGPALQGMRGGGLARGRLRWIDVLGAVFAVRYLDRPIGRGSFGGRWITGAAGVGVELGAGELAIGANVDGRAEYFEGRAAVGAARAALARWLPGVGVGLNGAWMPTSALGLFVGGEAAYMFGTTDLRVAGDLVATDPALRFDVEGGVRVRLW
jgi:hypothetical protein